MDTYPDISNHSNNYSKNVHKPSLGNLAIESKRSRHFLFLLIAFVIVAVAAIGMFAYEYYEAKQLKDKLMAMMGITSTSDVDYSHDAILNRDSKRKNDIRSIVSSATEYQSNNDGVSPFGSDGSKIVGSFVHNYIDEECPVLNNSGYLYFEEGCSDAFRDPLGVTYRMNYLGDMGKDDVRPNIDVFNYEIMVIAGAHCDPSSKYRVSYYGGRYMYVLLYVAENQVICEDNS